MAAFFGLSFWLGVFVAMAILYRRSGLSDAKRSHGVDWREFLMPNLFWFVLAFVKSFFWPLTLLVWLATGRPLSQWRAQVEVNGRPARRIVRVQA